MPEPTDIELEYYFGSDGNLGGPIDTGTPVDELSANNLIYKPQILPTTNVKRGVAYRHNASTGTLQNPRLAISTLGKRSTAGGVLRVASSSGADTGKVWVCLKTSTNWFSEELTLNGTTFVNATQLVDPNSDWVLVNELGNPAGNLTAQIDGVTVGLIRGSDDYGSKANFMASTLFELAAASAIGGTVAIADPDTDPTGTDSFVAAYQVPGDDQSIVAPADLGPSENWGYCVRVTIPANLPTPYGRQIVADVELLGDPVP